LFEVSEALLAMQDAVPQHTATCTSDHPASTSSDTTCSFQMTGKHAFGFVIGY